MDLVLLWLWHRQAWEHPCAAGAILRRQRKKERVEGRKERDKERKRKKAREKENPGVPCGPVGGLKIRCCCGRGSMRALGTVKRKKKSNKIK